MSSGRQGGIAVPGRPSRIASTSELRGTAGQRRRADVGTEAAGEGQPVAGAAVVHDQMRELGGAARRQLAGERGRGEQQQQREASRYACSRIPVSRAVIHAADQGR